MNPEDIRHLAKLSEALGDLSSVVGRCTVQGVDRRDPDTGKSNRAEMLHGLAGVVAAIELAALNFGLDEKDLTELIGDRRGELAAWRDEAHDKETTA